MGRRQNQTSIRVDSEYVKDTLEEVAEKEPESQTKKIPRRKRPHTPNCSSPKPHSKRDEDHGTPQFYGSSKKLLVKYRCYSEDKQKWMNVEGQDGSVIDVKLFRKGSTNVFLNLFKEGSPLVLKTIDITEVGNVEYLDDPLHIGFQAGSTQHKLEFLRTKEVEYFIDKLENARKLVKQKNHIQRASTEESRDDGDSTEEDEDDSELKLNDEEWMMVTFMKNLLYEQIATSSPHNPGTNRFWADFKLFSRDSKKSPEALRKIFLRKIFPNIHRLKWGREHTLTIYRELKRKIMPRLQLKLEQKFDVRLLLDNKLRLKSWSIESEIREKIDNLKREWELEKERRREMQKEEEEEESDVDLISMSEESQEDSGSEQGEGSDSKEIIGWEAYSERMLDSDFDDDSSFGL